MVGQGPFTTITVNQWYQMQDELRKLRELDRVASGIFQDEDCRCEFCDTHSDAILEWRRLKEGK